MISLTTSARALASVSLVALAFAAGCGRDSPAARVTCSDGASNGSESDIDCGGSCAPCPLTRACVTDGDCQSEHCLDGSCAECAAADDCPAPASECGTAECTAGACGVSWRAPGTDAPTQVAGDCHTRHCGADGAISDDVDEVDLPVDDDGCTADVCANGIPSNPAEPLDTACGAPGAGLRCDGLGACVQCLASSECPQGNGDCDVGACSAGTCVLARVPAGTPARGQTTGDCQVRVCDAEGSVHVDDAGGDLPVDDNTCTADVCTSGTPANPPEEAGAPCGAPGAGLRCDGYGACVACLDAGDCPLATGDCDVAVCTLGVCGVDDAPAETLARYQTSGDCQVRVCQADGTVRTDAADGDLPVDGKVCTLDLCTAGAPSNPPAPDTTPCGAASHCNGAGACGQCAVAGDCPPAAGDCDTATCVDGVCGFDWVAPSTLARTQVEHDCQSRLCGPGGTITTGNDDGDLPIDGNPCTLDVCASGTPTNPPAAVGLGCGTDLGCNGAGGCVSVMTIVTQPTDTEVIAPDAATFAVVTVGGDALSYQWQRNGVDIGGATSSTYTTGDTDFAEYPVSSAYDYAVRITGSSTVTTPSARLTVKAPNPSYPAGGDPQSVNGTVLTVLPSYHVDVVHWPNGTFRLGYAETLKNAAWTAYADFTVSVALANSTADYTTDTRLASPQVTKADMGTHGTLFYLANGKGFDRGHLVTRSDISYRYGPGAGDDATMMSNLIPQVSYLNQRLWQQLEDAVGGSGSGATFDSGLSRRFGRIWIYSGPVFTGTTQYWIPDESRYTTDPTSVASTANVAIAIPTAVYKIVVAEPYVGESLPRVLAWMCSNRDYTTVENADVWKYVTTVARVEALTGLDFFPNLPHDVSLAALKSTVDVRGFGTDFERSSGPNVHILEPSWDRVATVGNPILTGDPVAVGASVSFAGAATPNSAGGAIDVSTCTWTFGDGSSPVSGPTASHAWATPGTYTVTFTCETSSITRRIGVQ